MGITGNIDVPGGNVFWVPPKGVIGGILVNPDITLPEKLSPEIIGKSGRAINTNSIPTFQVMSYGRLY